LEAEGRSKATILKAHAQAETLKKIETELEKPGGFKAAQFIIGQKYIQALRRLSRSKNSLIMKVSPQGQEKDKYLNAKFP